MVKYKLTDETKELDGHILYRIEALVDFNDVKKGYKGGWIEKESNLSQEGNCWVYDNAWVSGNAVVRDNAVVSGNAKVLDNTVVRGDAVMSGYALVKDNAWVYGDAVVSGNACVYGDAIVYNNAVVSGNAKVCGNASVRGDTVVKDNAWVHGDAVVKDNAVVGGDAVVDGNAEVCGDATVKRKGDYLVFQNWWSSNRCFTYTKSNKMWKVGCFYGTGEELIKKAYVDSEEKGKMYELYVSTVEKGLEIMQK